MANLAGPLAILAAVTISAWVVQLVGAIFIEAKLWRKATEKRAMREVWFRRSSQVGTSPTPGTTRKTKRLPSRTTVELIDSSDDASLSSPTLRVDGRPILGWDGEHWATESHTIRSELLSRTEETAEKWRTIFAGLLAVFGAVLLVNKPDLTSDAIADPTFVRWAIITAIALALHAVAYTGWAAAGMPRMFVDLDGPTAFQAQMQQGARALIRLRVGITCGALTAGILTLAVAEALRPA